MDQVLPTSLLFTGHMIDLPDRAEPRFPASPKLEEAARASIGKAIEACAPIADSAPSLESSPVVGFASCARGGDILFHEECRCRQINTVIVLPFQPSEFVRSSVEGIPDGDWEARFWSLWNATDPQNQHVLGLPASDEAYRICNTRLLELARRHGRVHLIALWDGKGGDGPGGTADLIAKVRSEYDEPTIISLEKLQP
jgi:hypothetical protein